jgi:CubicO group peptidase (beta-lactamase class C family)
MPPAAKAGDFAYSKIGFIIVGAIAEARTGKSWEDLIREQIFTQLGIKSAGFGPPGTPGKLDQPCGHEEKAGKLVALDPASADADNPPVLGPAGTINIALKDWLLFAPGPTRRRARPRQTSETGNLSQTAHAGDWNYALGWGVKLDPGVPLLLTHTGRTDSGSPTSASCPSTT